MTENEKLRALLAEALDQHAHCLPCVPDCVWTRIDAALAEPVGDALEWQTAVTKALSESQERLAAELKEAQAELKRLKKATHTWSCQRQSAYNLSCVCGADKEQRDREHAAYQRGAEAMREAAANEADARARYWRKESVEDGVNTDREIRAEEARANAVDIRALPVPEEKP